MAEVEELGGSVVAISPENPQTVSVTLEKNRPQFEVLSDVRNHVARRFGLVFGLSEEVLEQMEGRIDLDAYYGEGHQSELPLTATYLIDTDGWIRFAFLNVDYRKRAEPADVLRVLRRLVQKE